MTVTIYPGDNRQWLAALKAQGAQFHSVVTKTRLVLRLRAAANRIRYEYEQVSENQKLHYMRCGVSSRRR